MANRTTDDFEQQRSRQVSGMRSVLDYLIGTVFIVIGITCFVKFQKDYVMLAFGGIAVLYGAWRLYKGFKKKV